MATKHYNYLRPTCRHCGERVGRFYELCVSCSYAEREREQTWAEFVAEFPQYESARRAY